LLGHLGEICAGSDVSATLQFDRVTTLPNIGSYLDCVPGGSKNNFKSYGHTVGELTDEQRTILCDPQTSGGLLCIVKPDGIDDFLKLTASAGLTLESIGQTRARGDRLIDVV
jgi:selenide,water dikinase